MRELALAFPYLRVDKKAGTVIDPVSSGNVGEVEDLAGWRDHAGHDVGFDEVITGLALGGLI